MIAVISDIHGNYPALHAVIEDIEKAGIEQVICLGDVAGYYCAINECIEVLRERKIFTLQGNHDYYLSSGEGCPRSKSANDCLSFQSQIITDVNKEWLNKITCSRHDNNNLSFVHAGWQDNLEEYLYELNEEYFKFYEFQYFFSGHTHVPIIFKMENKVYCNPGSVGQPRDGNPKASYAILNGNEIILKRVEYDIDFMAFLMKKNGFDSYYYEGLYKGLRIGGKPSITTIKGMSY